MVKQLKNISVLRFNEFSEEWKAEKFGDIVKINQGLQIPIADRLATEEEGSHFYITNEFLRFGSTKKYFIRNPPKSVLCTEDDILMTRTGNTGAVVTGVKGAFHNNFFKVAYPEHICKGFLYYYLTLHRTQDHIRKLAGTSTIPDLNHSDFYRIIMPYPGLQEQQKIASFLTAMDDKIQQLSKKKALLEQYKQGVMQQLFSQQIRFKHDDGKEFPDWEEKTLGDIAVITMGQSPDSASYNGEGNGIQLIQGNADMKNRLSYPRNWTTSPTKLCRPGDLILTVRAPVGSVGKAMHSACIGRGVCSIRNNEWSSVEFLYQFLLDYEPKWIRLEQGSTFTAVSGADIRTIELLVPSVEEQAKIASFLSAIDDKIDSVNQQIEHTRQFKKGLLQQMFV